MVRPRLRTRRSTRIIAVSAGTIHVQAGHQRMVIGSEPFPQPGTGLDDGRIAGEEVVERPTPAMGDRTATRDPCELPLHDAEGRLVNSGNRVEVSANDQRPAWKG